MSAPAPDRDARTGRFVIRSREEIDVAQKAILEAIEQCGFDESASFAVRTAMEEAIANAHAHGNSGDPGCAITVEFNLDLNSIVIDVQDEGPGFEPSSVPDPTRPENVDIPSGRGIMLMRVYMTEVEFLPPGNRVRMRYRKGGASPGQ